MIKTGYYDDFIAKNYNAHIKYNERVEILKNIIRKISIEYTDVLDLACGTGAVIDSIPKDLNTNIVGVDISPSMLRIARNHFLKHERIAFKKGDFLKVSFPLSAFDLIVIAHAIRFVPKGKEDTFVTSTAGWLKNNGIFLIIRYEMVQIPILTGILKRYFGNNKLPSPINSEKGLIEFMKPKFTLKEIFKTRVVFHKCVWYFPSRIVAYYFSKK